MTARNVLVIHLGATNSRSFLFNVTNDRVELISSQEILTIDDKDLVIESLKSKHKGEFGESIVIDNDRAEQEAFLAAVKLTSGDCDCLAIDLGSKKTYVGEGSFGRVKFQKYELGVGERVMEVLKDGSTDGIARFLSSPWKFADIENHLGQISLYPGIVPATADYLELTQSAARAVLANQQSTINGQQFTKVFLSGAVFGKAPELGQALLTFLDGLEPEGAFQVFIDQKLLFIALGALASTTNHQLPTTYQFTNLGSVFVLSHQHPEGVTIASLDLDLGLDEKLEVEVKSGEILRMPFSEESFGVVKLGLRSGVEVAGGKQKLKVEGGTLGLVIDARGRPLPKIPLNEEGRQKLKHWREGLEG
ncbi:MAG: hypothetical protein FJ044_00480 [Candidatus Cloacimonetes bacterium]|nr:hypothetical protein [Candidatus Cloacimonadota bacterium]